MSKNHLTLEERAVPKYPSLAKIRGYRLNNPSHKPTYIPTLEEAVYYCQLYSARIQQEARENIKDFKKY
jgi:hypothetical protein